MKLSFNWLRQYANVDRSPEEVGEILTMGGLEVEDIQRIGISLSGVVVGHVLKTWRHPNADRLTICEVDVNDGGPLQIACGAPNVAAGQRVPVATVGTTLLLPSRQNPQEPEPVTINRAKIRGELSEGMICAEDELGLSEDHAGIMVLDDSAAIGQPFSEYLRERDIEQSDFVLDVSITPNRPDATSHIGVARDVAALTGTPLTVPQIALPENGGEAARHVKVEILAPDECPRYVAMLVRGVEIGESPPWLKQRLTAIGLRPRNVVVDVTNFVLHECGQPLHAFDFDQISGSRIRVLRTMGESRFTTLDAKERMLPAGTLMICDADREVAIAGIMGGENSEVTSKTRNVLLESAFFDPTAIRRTARALGVQTDASYRFERGVDRNGQVWAAARAAHLITRLAGGAIVEGMVDAHPIPFERRRVTLRSSRVTKVVGIDIPLETTAALLESIGFDVVGETDHEPALTCTVPAYRPDIEREVDVIEEVVRLFGYDNVPEPKRAVAPASPPRGRAVDRLSGSARSLLSSIGFREIYTNSMQRAETARKFLGAEGEIVETLNPISQEMAALRPSLLPGALQVMSFNQKHGQRYLRFFEFGHLYRAANRPDTIIPGFEEHESLLVVASGPANVRGWDTDERPIDYFDLKGVVETLLPAVHTPSLRFESDDVSTGISSHHLRVYSGATQIATIARLSDEVAGSFDLKEPVFFAELNWERIVSLAAPHLERRYLPISRFPVVERDIAIVVDWSEPAARLMEAILEAGGDLLKQAGIFDLYEGEHVGPGKKSVAFSLRFGADRTLTDEEVDSGVAEIVRALEKKHGASLRA